MAHRDDVRPRSFAEALGRQSFALATLAVVLMLVALLGVVLANAAVWFWPMPVWVLERSDGSVLIGQIVERVEPSAATKLGARLYVKTGNRELTGSNFHWVALADVATATTPPDLARIVRRSYGDAYGSVAAIVADDAEHGPERLNALLRRTSRQQERLRSLEAQRTRVRRPLTRIEEALARSTRQLRTEEAASFEGKLATLERTLRTELDRLEKRISAIQRDLARRRLVVAAGEHRFVVPLTEVVEVTYPNRLVWHEELLLATRRGIRFVTSEPYAANTQGGVYPALFSTVLLVVLMTLAVVPLGVVTAVYLSEYARAGVGQRLARLAVHNLAGVPSIVFGMFGLAFFIYGIGGAVDQALFADQLPSPTFGTGGILWASLTLALLTLPVVVVATEEGLAAVPKGWRDGALALGATRWQTLRTVVLPAARPGVLTGVILAVSRAAGEVAPLMLTGVVKLTRGLPLDSEPPFLHLERKFMHLGYHIYDVSMQSPNVEVAKPMAFATAVVLILLVLGLNLAAVLIRRRLRIRLSGRPI